LNTVNRLSIKSLLVIWPLRKNWPSYWCSGRVSGVHMGNCKWQNLRLRAIGRHWERRKSALFWQKEL